MSFTVTKGGVIHSSRGVPQEPRWFADGRLSYEFSSHGITRVHFMAPIRHSNHVVFYQRNWDGFRFYVQKDLLTYKTELANCRVHPFGLEADWSFGAYQVRFRILAVGEAIVAQLETPAHAPGNLRFIMEFYDHFQLTPVDKADCRMAAWEADRKWRPWLFDAGQRLLRGGFTEHPHDGSRGESLDITVAADFPLEHTFRKAWAKEILRSGPLAPGMTYSYMVDFSWSGNAGDNARKKLVSLPELIWRQNDRYADVARKSPVLKSPYKALNDFVRLAPLYHEAQKIPYIPGAIRASNVHYWVWGWDGMTSNFSTGYWGDSEHVKHMLSLYERTADPVKGIGHAFHYDMVPSLFCSLPAQAMYICLLHTYYLFTRDIDTVRKHYGFALRVFRRIVTSEVGDTGFTGGTSLYPDFPDAMQETGSDISTFNNTVFYCSARAMDYLASAVGDEQGATDARAISGRMERAFVRLFFDTDKGFIVSSIDSTTLQQRQSYNLSSLKWENGYLKDLVESVSGRCMDFIDRHLVSAAGLRETPLWGKAFDGDGNQLHCWWPVNSEYFIRTVNDNNRVDLVERFIGYITQWMRRLTIPEGIPYYIETDHPDSDRWNTLNGAWQAYSIRGWYQAVVHGIVGFDLDAGGLTFYPYDGAEMTLEGVWCCGRQYDVKVKGSGRYIERIEANGACVRGTHKLPVDILEGRSSVTAYRTSVRPAGPFIRQADGVELKEFSYEDCVVRAFLKGEGLCRLKISAVSSPAVLLDGTPCAVKYDCELSTATVEIVFRHSEMRRLEIR